MNQCSGQVERLITIGASTGGPSALHKIFRGITHGSRAAIIVVQHMPEKFTQAFAERLNRSSAMHVMQAAEGMRVQPGCAYVAPGGMHLALERDVLGLVCRLESPAPSHHWIPSIDRLFVSAAAAMAPQLLAVVLTGMGSDGRCGVRAVFAAAGRVISESETTAIIFGMPKVAIDTGCVHEVLPLEAIVNKLCNFARGD